MLKNKDDLKIEDTLKKGDEKQNDKNLKIEYNLNKHN